MLQLRRHVFSIRKRWLEKIQKTYIDNESFCTDIEKIYPSYVSKHNSKYEKQMIPRKVGWHYIAVTKLSALLRGVTSKHNGDFYCLNCSSFRTEQWLQSHEREF